jgi:hypothetical protein
VTAGRASLLAFALTAAGCGAGAFVPPAGPGAPAPDAAAIWAQAIERCRGVDALVVSMRVSGRGIPSMTVDGAVTGAGRIMLRGRAGGTTQFELAGTAGDARLWVREGNRVARAQASDIVRTLVGVPMGPERLLAVLTGCATRDVALIGAARYGSQIGIDTADARVFLRASEAGWHPVGATFDGVVVTYRAFADGWPEELGLRVEPGGAADPRLSVVVNQRRAGDVPPEVFDVQIPEGAVPVELDDLAPRR